MKQPQEFYGSFIPLLSLAGMFRFRDAGEFACALICDENPHQARDRLKLEDVTRADKAAKKLAGFVWKTVESFVQSADTEIHEGHVPWKATARFELREASPETHERQAQLKA